MTKELATEIANNSEFLDQSKIVRVRAPRHLIFVMGKGDGGDNPDTISIPLCGDISNSVVALSRLHGVTCPNCLLRATELSAMDSYADAMAHVTSYAPTPLEPDERKAAARFAGQPTIEAEEHIRAQFFLQSKSLKRAIDLPKNIIGASSGTYYFNMVELRLIDTNGEAITAVITELTERRDDILSQ